MSKNKKEKPAPMDGEKERTEPAEQAPEEKTEEAPSEEQAPETFTVTREQMEKMEALAAQQAALNDKYLRLAAEYDNYRKRTAREKENTYQDAKMDSIKRLEMIFHQLENVLEKLGVTVEDPTGQAFDPLKHSAVMHVDDEKFGESIVSQVFQKGFLLGEKVIRFASVQVAN